VNRSCRTDANTPKSTRSSCAPHSCRSHTYSGKRRAADAAQLSSLACLRTVPSAAWPRPPACRPHP
jgi:hypothetical protein